MGNAEIFILYRNVLDGMDRVGIALDLKERGGGKGVLRLCAGREMKTGVYFLHAYFDCAMFVWFVVAAEGIIVPSTKYELQFHISRIRGNKFSLNKNVLNKVERFAIRIYSNNMQ